MQNQTQSQSQQTKDQSIADALRFVEELENVGGHVSAIRQMGRAREIETKAQAARAEHDNLADYVAGLRAEMRTASGEKYRALDREYNALAPRLRILAEQAKAYHDQAVDVRATIEAERPEFRDYQRSIGRLALAGDPLVQLRLIKREAVERLARTPVHVPEPEPAAKDRVTSEDVAIRAEGGEDLAATAEVKIHVGRDHLLSGQPEKAKVAFSAAEMFILYARVDEQEKRRLTGFLRQEWTKLALADNSVKAELVKIEQLAELAFAEDDPKLVRLAIQRLNDLEGARRQYVFKDARRRVVRAYAQLISLDERDAVQAVQGGASRRETIEAYAERWGLPAAMRLKALLAKRVPNAPKAWKSPEAPAEAPAEVAPAPAPIVAPVPAPAAPAAAATPDTYGDAMYAAPPATTEDENEAEAQMRAAGWI